MDDVSQSETAETADLLSDEQARVIGCLVEKHMTTPDLYPMSLNGITLAANQKSNRQPVVDYSEALVERTLRDLADAGLVRMVHRQGDRVVKYRHALGEHLTIDEPKLALIAVLLLRGAQTPGELRQRTQRYTDFASLAALEATLDDLVGSGLVVRLERQPGQKESRYVEQVSGKGTEAVAGLDLADVSRSTAGRDVVDDQPGLRDEMTDLRTEVAELRGRFERLLEQLGVEDV
jgi:uncharacterized protein YceH (UPF0502 family)